MYIVPPKQIAGRGPVDWNVPRPKMVAEFRRLLRQAAAEKEFQIFLEQNPVALLTGILKPHMAWVLARQSLPEPDGGGWVPDFILCEWSSVGPAWTVVELKSPTKTAATRNGVSATCRHAEEQINSYRTYLRDHVEFLRAGGWPGIHGQCEGVIVIGRRDEPNRAQHSKKLEAFREQRIEIMSYDRLLESCEDMQRFIESQRSPIRSALDYGGTRRGKP